MDNIAAARFLIDKYFSLEWCKDNVLTPVSIEKITFSKEPFLLIIVGNLSYFATLDSLVRKRIGQFNLKCIFLEENSDKIYDIIDRASRINPQDFALENKQFNDEHLSNNYNEHRKLEVEILEDQSKYRAKKRDLEELKDFFEANLINEEDYEKAKGKVLDL